jgi:spermidine/putrescine transport system permease protein
MTTPGKIMFDNTAQHALERHELLRRWVLILPAGIIIVAFMLLPMILMAFISILEPGNFGGVKWGQYSLEAYIKFLFERDLSENLVPNTDYLSIFSRSFLLSAGTTFWTLLIGFPSALYIALQAPKRRALLIFLVSIPFWTNLLVRTYSWILLLRNGGLIESGLESLGYRGGSLNLLYTDFAVQIGLVYSFLPFMVLPIYTSLEKLDWRLVEAAFDLGANRLSALRRVIVPLAWPGVISGCVLVFIPALGSFFVPELLGGSKALMIGNLIQNQFGASRNWPFGAALAFALLAIVLIAMMLYALRFQRGLEANR